MSFLEIDYFVYGNDVSPSGVHVPVPGLKPRVERKMHILHKSSWSQLMLNRPGPFISNSGLVYTFSSMRVRR